MLAPRITFGVIFYLIRVQLAETSSESSNSSVKYIQYEHFQIEKNHQKAVPVPPKGGSPLIVDIEILVWSIIEVSAQRLDMEVDLYINFWWNDYRVNLTRKNNKTIPISDEAAQLWRPYVVFRNCKGCSALDLDPDKNDVYMNLDTGRIQISVRSLSRFICPIDLRAYPMDKQLCKIQLVNYVEDTKTIFFNHVYTDRLRKVLSGHVLSEYMVADISRGNCTWPIHDGTILSCIEMEVHLVRRLGHYVISIYAPTFLIVVLSWISFWLPSENPPARITLGVTSLLTLATRLDQAQKNLPPVSYVKAIDIWMMACLFLVFASLVEFAIVNSLWRKGVENSKVAVGTVTRITSITGKEISSTTRKSSDVNSMQQWSLRVDLTCRFLFPIAFFAFNIGYWSSYL